MAKKKGVSWIAYIKWIWQFKQVKYDKLNQNSRCVSCDAGNYGPKKEVTCSIYGCPCNMDEHLILRKKK